MDRTMFLEITEIVMMNSVAPRHLKGASIREPEGVVIKKRKD